jgi:hypothetical protein
MTPKSEIEKITNSIMYPNCNNDLDQKTIEMFRKIWRTGFKFAEWLQVHWVFTGDGWVKWQYPDFSSKKSIEELFEMFLKEVK